MSIEQAFVGAVAIILGLVCATVSLFEISWFFRLPKARSAEARWGRRATRIGFGLLGLSLILLGWYIVTGIQLPRDG